MPDVRVAFERLNHIMKSSSSIGYYYDVPIGSSDKNSDCQIYNFSDLSPESLDVALLPADDCSLAAEIILKYTSQLGDMQAEAERRGLEISSITEQELSELYAVTRYFGTAISYAFRELKGLAYEYEFYMAGEIPERKAWPWGLTESGVFLPPGGVVEYTVQDGDTWQSISSMFVGDPVRGPQIAEINLDETFIKPPSGEKIYVPLEIARWVEVDMNVQSPEQVAQQIYGDRAFSEMIVRRCRVRAGITVPRCVVPVFHDVRALYEAFFAE